MYRLYNMGDKLNPCGTPASIVLRLEVRFATLTGSDGRLEKI